MTRFLIEIPHEADPVACARAIHILLKSGSHFLTNADWGCTDGEHMAWIIVEANTKEEVEHVIPPAYRPQAKIVKLNKFKLEDIEELIKHHEQQT
jgi:hypothetical protein